MPAPTSVLALEQVQVMMKYAGMQKLAAILVIGRMY